VKAITKFKVSCFFSDSQCTCIVSSKEVTHCGTAKGVCYSGQTHMFPNRQNQWLYVWMIPISKEKFMKTVQGINLLKAH